MAKANGLIPIRIFEIATGETANNPEDIDYLWLWNAALAEK